MILKNKFLSFIALITLFAGVGIVTPHAIFAQGDTVPPYLVSPFPEPGSTYNSYEVPIKVGVFDDLSGVDPISPKISINNGPFVEPIIEPSSHGEEKGVLLYYSESLPEGVTLVTVAVRAYDKAGNEMNASWQFSIEEMKFNQFLKPVYPLDQAWLSYKYENQRVRFSWSKGAVSESYRLWLKTSKMAEPAHLDLMPGGTVPYTEFLGLIVTEFELAFDDWQLMNSVGELSWKVAPISDETRDLVGPYTEPRTVRYAAGEFIQLVAPEMGAILDQSTPPTFEWESMSGVTSYLFVMVQLDAQGNPTDNVSYAFLPYGIGVLELMPSSWQGIENGRWMWSVVGVLPGNLYSGYIINQFKKVDVK